MRLTQIVFRTLALSMFFAGAVAQAATVSGTVTNKTTGKPSPGDTVVLVDVQAGMGEVAKATTDGSGKYTLNMPGSGPYLIRATHQGAGSFIAAPQGGGPGADISVYDVAAKVSGVFIEADVLEVEADNGQLKVNERYFVHNTSQPPTTQWSKHSFEIILPENATLGAAGSQRPGGLPTSTKVEPSGAKGHYSFSVPIEPDKADKDTLFQISYTLPYGGGKYDFKSAVTLPADNFAVLMPKSMTFTAGPGQNFRPVQEDPGVQTFIVKNAVPEKPITFSVSGNGSMPREDQSAGAGAQGGMGGQGAAGQPGGGIGEPINTPDPLSKYKWWILGGLALLLTAGAAFLLRRPAGGAAPVAIAGASVPAVAHSSNVAYQPVVSVASKHSALLNVLKDELFAIESEKIAGTLSPEEYLKVKSALETVLARALKRNG
jgi:hypothetical protein